MNTEAKLENAHAGVTFPPPFIFLGSILVAVGIQFFYPVPLIENYFRYVVGAILIVPPVGLMVWAVRTFDAVGTAVPPWKPSTTIVSSGPYRFTQNPMYLSFSFIQAGIAFLVNSAWMLILLAPVLVIVRYAVIAREERYLEAKFGDGYRQYRKQVRRWL